jgi:transcriptional regulator with XRE-family HTH domain
MPKKEKFGEKVKRLRTAKGFSQKELAEKVGVTREHLTRLETNDQVQPLWQTVQNLAEALGVECTAFQEERRAGPSEPAAAKKPVKGKKPKKNGA